MDVYLKVTWDTTNHQGDRNTHRSPIINGYATAHAAIANPTQNNIPISVRHCRVTFLNIGTLRNFVMSVWLRLVSKMYPNGIQCMNLRSVSSVDTTSMAFCEWNRTYWQSWKMCENSLHIESFKCLIFVWVIWPSEKSNTSSLSSFMMTILFWHRASLLRLLPTISWMNVGQFFGHSCFRICNVGWHRSMRAVWRVFGWLQPDNIWCWIKLGYETIGQSRTDNILKNRTIHAYNNLWPAWEWISH